MRTRTKYDESVYSDISGQREDRHATRANVNDPWTAFSAWAPNNSGVSSILLSDGESSIIDDPSPSKSVKPVTHYKRKFSRRAFPQYSEYTDTDWYEVRGVQDVHFGVSWGSYGKVLHSDLLASYPKTINQLKVEAMHKFHKSNEVDTLLNIMESPQLITSASQLVRLMKAKKFALAGSSGFLGWSFGLAPLIADIRKVNGAIANIKRDMDNYVRNNKSEHRVSAVSIGTISPNITAVGYSANANNNDGSHWHVGINPTVLPTLRVGVSGRRNVEYNSEAFKKLDYLIKRFIATGPAGLAWEKVPFSFVLDWFVNLSGVVDALDNALTGNSRHINSIWMSEKWSVLVPVYKHKQVNWTSDSDGEQTALNELSYYHRESVLPDPSISLSGRFGKKQAALTAALIHQLVANLRAWR